MISNNWKFESRVVNTLVDLDSNSCLKILRPPLVKSYGRLHQFIFIFIINSKPISEFERTILNLRWIKTFFRQIGCMFAIRGNVQLTLWGNKEPCVNFAYHITSWTGHLLFNYREKNCFCQWHINLINLFYANIASQDIR